MNNNYMYVLIADSIQFSPGYGENFILLSGEKWRRKHGKKKKKNSSYLYINLQTEECSEDY